jgi:hypothetical protein
MARVRESCRPRLALIGVAVAAFASPSALRWRLVLWARLCGRDQRGRRRYHRPRHWRASSLPHGRYTRTVERRLLFARGQGIQQPVGARARGHAPLRHRMRGSLRPHAGVRLRGRHRDQPAYGRARYACQMHISPNGNDRVDEVIGLETQARHEGRGMWGQCQVVACD